MLLVPGSSEPRHGAFIDPVACVCVLILQKAFRTGTSTRLDDRVFAMCQLKYQPLAYAMLMIHPALYRVDDLTDEVRRMTFPFSARVSLLVEREKIVSLEADVSDDAKERLYLFSELFYLLFRLYNWYQIENLTDMYLVIWFGIWFFLFCVLDYF